MDTFITRSSSSRLVPVNTNSQSNKSEDESDSEATATVIKKHNCSDNASQAKNKKYEDNYLNYAYGFVVRQKNSPRSSSLGRKSRTAFANSAIWQFRSQMATELIT